MGVVRRRASWTEMSKQAARPPASCPSMSWLLAGWLAGWPAGPGRNQDLCRRAMCVVPFFPLVLLAPPMPSSLLLCLLRFPPCCAPACRHD